MGIKHSSITPLDPIYMVSLKQWNQTGLSFENDICALLQPCILAINVFGAFSNKILWGQFILVVRLAVLLWIFAAYRINTPQY